MVRARLPLFIYNALFPVAFAAMLPGLVRRMARRGDYRRNFGQRFAKYGAEARERLGAEGGRVWVHSISVGETLLALRLIERMRVLEPGLRFVLSATTTTGYALAAENATGWLEPIYNPLDALPLVRRALDVIRPARLIFIEATWPNLLTQAAARGIPVGLIARLSPRSERRFRRFRAFTGPIFRQLDAISVQEPGDVETWRALGADAASIRVTGNIKFDLSATRDARAGVFRELLASLGVPADAPVLLGGSTFPGEEGMLARIAARLRSRFPGLFLIIVPRHVERANEAAAEITEAGLIFALRSAASRRETPPDCLLVNTTGELRAWYELATVVYIGKSMSPAASGGQNPIEPVSAGKPVVFGPRMENFRTIVARLLEGDAAISAADEAALEAEVGALLDDPARREALAQRALAMVRAHQGAAERTARLLLDMRSASAQDSL